MEFIKITFDVWYHKIVPTLSKMHGIRRPGFGGEKMVKTMSFRPVAAKLFILKCLVYSLWLPDLFG